MGVYRSDIEMENPTAMQCNTIFCSHSRVDAIAAALEKLKDRVDFDVIASSALSHNQMYMTDQDGRMYQFTLSDYI